MFLEFCTYVLFSHKDGDLYVGFSSNLSQRLDDHKKGRVASTKARRPLELAYCEFHRNKYDALRREIYLKTSSGKKGLRLMIRESLKQINGSKVK